ncbi:MAG: hypothetical protein ABSB42_21640 [Tepidisphaeraceae bacterium]|jgi:hypothetical protein
MGKPTEMQVCYHCGNRVPLKRIGYRRGQELYEQIDNKRYTEEFAFYLYRCPTCEGVSIYGDFAAFPRTKSMARQRIYPRGPLLVPESHKVVSAECIPKHIVEVYERIWPLRHIDPNAFSGQVRRALEFICRSYNRKSWMVGG